LGLFIGCTPFFGFHLALSVAFAWLFGLNRFIVYVASNISNPFVAPFLIAAELQAGAWLSREAWLTPLTLGSVGFGNIAYDLLLGSVVVGGATAFVGAGATYLVVMRRALHPTVAALVEKTASRYLPTGCASWEFANGKLRFDPVYREILQRGLLPSRGTLLDLGCGQGLMLALLATAKELYRTHAWPPTWPQPPALRLHGVEIRPRMVAHAQAALGNDATIVHGDLRTTLLPRCDVALLFDVAHLMPRADQDRLLARLAEVIEPGGLLVLREADAAAGLRFWAVRVGNWLCHAAQGRWHSRFHYRTAAAWRERLAEMGFEIESEPMGQGTPFANVVIYARLSVDRALSNGRIQRTPQ
jgi:trans-aconitate methyltransferase